MEVQFPLVMQIVNPVLSVMLSESGGIILIVFSERVMNFGVEHIEVTGGTIDDLVGDSRQFQCPYTKTGETMTVRIPAGAVACYMLADCWNTESNTLEL